MSKGTHEGDLDEINFVRLFNSEKENFSSYLNTFTSDYSDFWMIRVTTKQTSALNGQKVFTRADCYLAEVTEDISDLLIENELYLSEDILNENHVEYRKIPFSGISIKMTSSEHFQILKVRPDSFYNLFGNYELGAGASLFCMRKEELIKNEALLAGWKTTPEKMSNYFNSLTNGDLDFYKKQLVCNEIKIYSVKEIKKIIDSDRILQEKIFNGKYLYEEPYSAYYFYHGDCIEELKTLPFYVTTGSGRSHGDYTIVLKPTQ